jgi:hypothetical protein
MDVKTTLAALLIFFLVGCNTHPIPDTFLPLEELVERPWPGSYITTINTSVWAENIEDYLNRKPEWSPLYVADMIHERIHAIRMGGWFGTGIFILQYGLSTDFMWEEECIGWYYQLMYLKSKGIVKDPTYTAVFLSIGYENITGSMISLEDALRWVQDVYAGKWKPDISKEEEDLYYTSVVEKLNAR